MSTFMQQLINGLILGSVYAIVALGYTIVYGVLRLFNFAHGELFMLGAYIGIFTITAIIKGPAVGIAIVIVTLIVAFLASMFGVGGAGMLVEQLAYRPVSKSTRLAQLISVLGASIVLQNIVMIVVGKRNIYFPKILETKVYNLNGVNITNIQVFIFLLAIVLLLALYLFVNKTMFGLTIRAVSENRMAASLMGIDSSIIVVLVFVIGPALGGIAGVMYSMYYGTAIYTMGYVIGIKAFTATVLGGIGSIAGAMLGGVFLGLAENIGAGFLPILTGGLLGPEYKDIFAFIVLILILIIKPEGIFGERG